MANWSKPPQVVVVDEGADQGPSPEAWDWMQRLQAQLRRTARQQAAIATHGEAADRNPDGGAKGASPRGAV